ncbi:hypothetical protein ACFQZ4_34895 [Catellatospora coxensis]
MEFVLFPGRHHLLTRFQAERLVELAARHGATVVWAVTSANHDNTRRNPVPYHRREAAIERFSATTGLRSVVVPVFDMPPTPRFAEVTIKNITAATGIELSPHNTVVACSTPTSPRCTSGSASRSTPSRPDSPPPPNAPGTSCCAWPRATRAGVSWHIPRPPTCSTATASPRRCAPSSTTRSSATRAA